jgi:adenylate kinase family enzyme
MCTEQFLLAEADARAGKARSERRMYGALMPWTAFDSELPSRPSRILVAGTAGSGKSTLARGISRILEDVEYFEIDALYHGPEWTPNPRFAVEVDGRIVGPAWVTEWQYHTVRDLLADRAGLLVWLDLPLQVVMRSIMARTVRRSLLGVELWNGNREPRLQTILHDPDHIIRWAWRTHAQTAARVRACVQSRPTLHAVALRSRAQAEAWLMGPLSRSAHRT